jgi:hypothetical protein
MSSSSVPAVASTGIMHDRFDLIVETAYLLLKREFEYDFVSVLWFC